MKIDPRLSEEFGTPLPYPTRSWGDWAADNFIPITVNTGLMTLGALAQYFVSWSWSLLLGISAVGFVILFACFILGLVHDAMFEPPWKEDD